MPEEPNTDMSCIQGLLASICPEIERQLRPNLRGIKGLLVRGYLPQTWVFETESETVTLLVDSQGAVSTQPSAPLHRDVTIRWKHDFLSSVLRTRSRASVPGGIRPVVMFHTPKGRRAFNFLKKRFGL